MQNQIIKGFKNNLARHQFCRGQSSDSTLFELSFQFYIRLGNFLEYSTEIQLEYLITSLLLSKVAQNTLFFLLCLSNKRKI